jgi:hypothetical protein
MNCAPSGTAVSPIGCAASGLLYQSPTRLMTACTTSFGSVA